SDTGDIVKDSAFYKIKEKFASVTDYLLQMQDNGSFDVMAEKFTSFTQKVCDGVDNAIPKIQSGFQYVQNNGPQIRTIIDYIAKAFVGWKVISGVSSGVQAIRSVYNS
ncbi:hypothetical protein KFV96_28135, partial [Klebsiella pneumoniae]|nr:hypothetical protein [Klebsiella pneumoniae]